jgi:hypothetical protein
MSTARAKRWMSRVVEYGCIFCWRIFGFPSPAEIHHVREGRRPRNDEEVLPACPSHHRNGPLSIHFTKPALLAACGAESEQELLNEIRQKLGEPA